MAKRQLTTGAPDPRAERGEGVQDDALGPASLAPRLTRVARMMERHTARVLRRDFHISLAEWRVLGQVARLGPQTVRDMAERSWVDRAEVSRAAKSLLQRGYLVREENPLDRRSPLFSCTQTGAELHASVQPDRERFQQRLLEKLGDTADAFLQGIDYLSDYLLEEERRRALRRRSSETSKT